MPFAYTTGDPANLVGGEPASMTDVQGPFNDIEAYLNSGLIDDLAKGQLVVGELRWMAVAVAPAGWLLCDGAAYSRTTYQKLFSALGGTSSPWGLGDGTNTFNVPDLRGRTAVGTGQGAGLTSRSIAAKFGTEAETLSVGQMPAHAHGVSDPTHAHSIYDPGHAHSEVYSGGAANRGQSSSASPGGGQESLAYTNHTHALTGTNTGASGTGIGIYGASTGVSIQNAGGGAAHNNMPPAVAIPAYIYAGV